MRFASTPASHKVIRSFTEMKRKGVPFGDSNTHVPAIDQIASERYDEKLAYIMSTISTWAYADERALGAKLRYCGIEGARVRRISVQNDALFVVATAYLIQSASGRVGILAFRGTDPASFVTMLADGEVMQRRFDGCGVHAGFYANVEAVWDDVTETIEAALHREQLVDDGRHTEVPNTLESLYITGHSLGGAMAVLAAARLFGRGYESWKPRDLVKGIYTFGQPMVGDQKFAEKCDQYFGPKLFRHVYGSDVVPHLPPQSDLPYAHTSREWRAPGISHPWEGGHEASRRASLAESLVGVAVNAVELRLVPDRRLHGYSIDDHMPSNYMDVSRYTVDPGSVAFAMPPRRRIPRLAEIPSEVADGVGRAMKKMFQAENGGSRLRS